MASSTRGKRSAAAAAAATQETGTPAKVARVGGAEPAVKDKVKKKGESVCSSFQSDPPLHHLSEGCVYLQPKHINACHLHLQSPAASVPLTFISISLTN